MKKKWWVLFCCLLLVIVDFFYYRTHYMHMYVNVFSSSSPYFLHVDLDENVLYVFKDDVLVQTYPISGGATATPSPLGTWTIVSKSRWGEGFGGTWMGFNVPWGKYGIHGTNEPWSIGHSMSLGCIRMYNEDAEELRKTIPVGTKITIVKGIYGPFGDGFRTLKPGHIGADVFAVERKLQSMGFYNGWVNGVYDAPLREAVHRFQKHYELPVSDAITEDDYEKMGFIPFE